MLSETRPPERELYHGSAGYAELRVVEHRRWDESRPGVRTPARDRVEIQLTAGDFCTGPEMLSVGEAIELRDALDKAIRAAQVKHPLGCDNSRFCPHIEPLDLPRGCH